MNDDYKLEDATWVATTLRVDDPVKGAGSCKKRPNAAYCDITSRKHVQAVTKKKLTFYSSMIVLANILIRLFIKTKEAKLLTQ